MDAPTSFSAQPPPLDAPFATRLPRSRLDGEDLRILCNLRILFERITFLLFDTIHRDDDDGEDESGVADKDNDVHGLDNRTKQFNQYYESSNF
ncbi:unnamed protein product [Echinostoma caproni]|uniref:Uncharacterized protein n=1 Tax=Echinostoma caproni TaxID=27848 RepID=A0A183AJL5_9TREM|nr:unnamed protein product [Echinostoma caproni]